LELGHDFSVFAVNSSLIDMRKKGLLELGSAGKISATAKNTSDI